MDKFIETAVKALDSKKAKEIKVIEVDKATSYTDAFIICNGTSSTQIKALADECEYQLEQLGCAVSHREGRESGTWILLDYKDFIVHIFTKETRDFYDLERLWRDGNEIDITGILEEN